MGDVAGERRSHPLAGLGYPRRRLPAGGVTGITEIPTEHEDLIDLVRELAQKEIAPRAADIDASGEYPWDVRRLLSEQNVLGLPFAEAHGGRERGR